MNIVVTVGGILRRLMQRQTHIGGTQWRSCCTALQTGRSWDQFPMVSLEFFIDKILLAALWPWG
jgi:hypothetical protein